MTKEDKYMVSVEEARKLLLHNVSLLPAAETDLMHSTGMILAEDIHSPVNMPPFRQSAMDGYAIRFKDLDKGILELMDEIPAGGVFRGTMEEGCAVRIFTGAKVPDDADSVVEQERVHRESGRIRIETEGYKFGANIRAEGSQIRKGEIALTRGTYLNPACLGFLAGIGIQKLKTYSQPRISVIVTGSELQKPGNELAEGEVYESNSYALYSALQSMGMKPMSCEVLRDDFENISRVLFERVGNSDVIILTGGISVGDYDFVRVLLEKENIENIFYKIRQKPGKPIWFGKYRSTLIFALPGNPASVMTCFYEYVYPSLRKMAGFSNPGLKKEKRKLYNDFRKKKGLANYLKGKFIDDKVLIMEGQESYKMNSFAMADCFVYLEPDAEYVQAGDWVEVHKLPYPGANQDEESRHRILSDEGFIMTDLK
ncbi:MAG: molybdopterin molybdenumtransferase MoeA [Bacteroidetes bacterium]|nr:MAG: molybdopterin molybdenumtransferase MoeA [Bacteroidota bacterium]REK00785.1 MAG: molybdopterin molybdenumtransferase MoeA [Bacteroidota bacterium]REK35033.1 MAG: molybdopterin molybdenumtransferase MoeA [Bacteroidota bacterium]REK48168.1 MAG: molybdopterin molybdenumtransferase MoeA [Bacteroidota bacterium]